jgi:hypothetical protein
MNQLEKKNRLISITGSSNVGGSHKNKTDSPLTGEESVSGYDTETVLLVQNG